MAGERKENSVLFSLKELKDFASEEPQEEVARPGASLKASSTPAPRRSGALDDMGSLLADLKNEVNEDIAAEERRLKEERERQREAEERKIRETATMQRAEIEAKIAAEQARRRAAEDERLERLRRQDIEERRARGEIIDEPEPQVAVEVVPAPSFDALSADKVAPTALAPQPPAGRGTGFYLTVVGLPVLCVTAVAIAFIMKQEPPPAAPAQPIVVNVAPQTTPPPMPPTATLTAVPVAAPATVVADADKAEKKKPAGGRKPGGVAKPAGEKPAPKPAGIKIDLNAD